MRKRLGEILLERALIDQLHLQEALAYQRQWGTRLGTALVAKGYIAEGTLTRILSESLGFPMVDLARVIIDPKALALVPQRTCEAHDVLPLGVKEQASGRRVLLLAMADPLNATVVDEIAFTTDAVVKPAIAQISSIGQAIRRHYQGVDIEIAALDFTTRPRGEFTPFDSGQMTITTLSGGDERTVAAREPGSDPLLELTGDIIAEAAARPALPDDYAGHRTGVFSMPALVAELPRTMTPVVQGRSVSDDNVAVVQVTELQRLEVIEKHFWALMRVLARRGVLNKDEFLTEVRATDER